MTVPAPMGYFVLSKPRLIDGLKYADPRRRHHLRNLGLNLDKR